MSHVFAQMSVAVTSRAMLVSLDVVGVPSELAYVLALWLPVVASATAAEMLVCHSKDRYMTFAVDVRYGSTWHENDVVGCAYPQTGALFVKRGDEFRPADVLLDHNVDVVAGVCAPAKARS